MTAITACSFREVYLPLGPTWRVHPQACWKVIGKNACNIALTAMLLRSGRLNIPISPLMAVVRTWSPEEVEQELRERWDGLPRLEAWFKRLVSRRVIDILTRHFGAAIRGW